MKVSFDFDHTLTNPKLQTLASVFIKENNEVWITTSRTKDKPGIKLTYDNREVFAMAEKLGIKKEHIQFTNYDEKYKYLKDFHLHFDDDEEEIELINDHPSKCIGVLIE